MNDRYQFCVTLIRLVLNLILIKFVVEENCNKFKDLFDMFRLEL